MIAYISKAAFAWFMGFFPFFEIYAAVPASMAIGLDHFSAAFWSVFGNYCPVLLIVFGYERLMRIERVRNWLTKRSSERFQRLIDRYGSWFVLLVTPWIGVWVVAATAQLLGMRRSSLLLFSLISISVYGFAIAFGIDRGIAVFSGGS